MIYMGAGFELEFESRPFVLLCRCVFCVLKSGFKRCADGFDECPSVDCCGD